MNDAQSLKNPWLWRYIYPKKTQPAQEADEEDGNFFLNYFTASLESNLEAVMDDAFDSWDELKFLMGFGDEDEEHYLVIVVTEGSISIEAYLNVVGYLSQLEDGIKYSILEQNDPRIEQAIEEIESLGCQRDGLDLIVIRPTIIN